ncbi:hypothetical protein HRF87_05700 [Bacillus sp. CRN 9]|nr:hypothetical protein [Bacillus sp. CRN 9]
MNKNNISNIREKILKSKNELKIRMMLIAEKTLKEHLNLFYFHDLEVIEKIGQAPYLWIVRENGTHLINLSITVFTKENEWLSTYVFNNVLLNYSDIKQIYFCENEQLTALSEVKSVLLLQEYENSIRKHIKTIAGDSYGA